jgi:small-conductance mechanosensitive channel
MYRQLTQEIFDALRGLVGWVPDWALGLGVLVLSAAIAVIVHAIVWRALYRFAGAEGSYTRSLLIRVRNPSRLALVLLAVAASANSAAFSPAASEVLSRLLVVGSIVAAGWAACVAVDLAAGLYLARIKAHGTDLLARKHVTQVRILKRAAFTLVVLVTTAAALMTIEAVRQYGVSLFASAGVAGLVIGLAARPVLTNVIAGLQLAVTQPIRIDDEVIVEGEFGTVEEITGTYVVVRLWDWRRLVVPLSYFLEKPFQNWTRETTSIIGSVILYTDFAAPIDAMREELNRVLRATKLWDEQVANLQVTDATPQALQVRMLVSARTAGQAWDLRCEVREKMIAFLRERHPESLPLLRRLDVSRERAGDGHAREDAERAERDRLKAAARH